MSHAEEQIYSNVIHSASQTVSNLGDAAIKLATSYALSKSPQVRAQVSRENRTAEHDLFDAREMLKEGQNPEDIRIEIRQGPSAQTCDDPELYAKVIVDMADCQNILEELPPIEAEIEQGQDLQLGG